MSFTDTKNLFMSVLEERFNTAHAAVKEIAQDFQDGQFTRDVKGAVKEAKDKYEAFYDEHYLGIESAKHISTCFVRGFAIGTAMGLLSLAAPKVLAPLFLLSSVGLAFWDGQVQGDKFISRMEVLELRMRAKKQGVDNVVDITTRLN